MTGILFAVFGRFLLAFCAIAASLGALVAVAAFADGRPPRPDRLAQVIGGFAPAVAAVWVLLDQRRHGEDVALASLGVRPLIVAGLLLVSATPLFALDRPAPDDGIHATATRLSGPDLTIEWRDGAAWRSDADTPFPGLPPPPAMPRTAAPAWRSVAARALVLAIGLLALARVRDAPGLIAGLAVAGLVFWAGA